MVLSEARDTGSAASVLGNETKRAKLIERHPLPLFAKAIAIIVAAA